MIKVSESDFKKMQPGINRVLVIPETDNHVDSVTGIQVVRDESEREQGVIIAVSAEAKDAGYKKGDHIVYAKTSMEVFVCEVSSGDSVTEQRLRVIDWHDIAIKI